MADDPRKKGRDRKFVSQQPHEQAYQRHKNKSEGNSQSAGQKGRSGNRSSSTGDSGSERSGSNGGR